MRYYSLHRCIKADCDYNFIFGGRANGKSYQIVKHVIDDFFENGHQFARVNRFTQANQEDKMLDWIHEELREYTRKEYNHEIYFEGRNWYCIELNKDGSVPKIKVGKAKKMGYLFILNLQQNYKSEQFEHVYNLVFEEFILINTIDYLPKEVDLFMSLVSTICRHRNIKVYFVGNNITKFNPYFTYFNINLEKLNIKQGEYRILQDKNFKEGATIFVEYARISYSLESEIPRVLRVGYNEIATTGDFVSSDYILNSEELSEVKHLKNLDPIFGVLTKEGYYTCYAEVTNTKKRLFFIKWNMLPIDKTFDLETRAFYNKGLNLKLFKSLVNGKSRITPDIFYQDGYIENIVINILNNRY